MSTIKFISSPTETRKRNTPYDIWLDAGNTGTEADYELALHGYTSAQVRLMKKFQTAPTQTYKQEGGTDVTYTFDNGNISFAGSSAGWTKDPPTGAGDIYVIYALAVSKDSTDVISADEFTFPAILSTEGSEGQSGRSVTSVFVFKASSTQPSAPSGNISYDFSDGTISGLSDGWSRNTEGDKVWISFATASAILTQYDTTASLTNWSTPEVFKEKGAKGDKGATWYNGQDITGTTTYTGGHAGELGDMYLNSDTGNVYECTTAGTIYTAVWTYRSNIKGPQGEEGATWYSGVAITGTSTFTGGHAGELGDMYLNTETGNVYECTTAGTISTAVWTYRSNIKGPQGDLGEPAYVFDFMLESELFTVNKRLSTGTTDIAITRIIQGYSSSVVPTFTLDEDTYALNVVDFELDDDLIPIGIKVPYTFPLDKITITMSATDIPPVSRTIKSKDETEYNHNFGLKNTDPESFVDDKGRTCGLLDGDFFVAGSNHTRINQSAWVRDNNAWVELDSSNPQNIDKLMSLLNSVLKDGEVEDTGTFFSVWTEHLIASDIAVDKLTAKEAFIEKLKSTIAEFDNLTVNSSAKFKGEILNDIFETILTPSNSNTYIKGADTTEYWNKTRVYNKMLTVASASSISGMVALSNSTYSSTQLSYIRIGSGDVRVLEGITGTPTQSHSDSYTSHVKASLHISASARYQTWTDYSDGWEYVDSYTITDSPVPPQYIEPEPQNPYLGQTWVNTTNITQKGNRYSWTETTYEWSREEVEHAQASYITIKKNNTTIAIDTSYNDYLDVNKNDEISIIYSALSEQSDATIYNALYYIDNRNTVSSNPQLYDSNGNQVNISSNFSSATLTVKTSGNVTLFDTTNSSSWQDSERFMLFRAKISPNTSITGTITESYFDDDTSSFNITTCKNDGTLASYTTPQNLKINSLSISSSSMELSYSDGSNSYAIPFSGYVKKGYSFSIKCYTKAVGIYSKSIQPFDSSDTYYIGSENKQFTVYGAVFN